ncbi:MAG TPA: zinc ribbon domain-containing protein [Armatimonadota bacterium]|nr:zinc ribbon domain-containing protein [Armatimonadota bacterium]
MTARARRSRKPKVPIYEFRCSACDHEFEALCRMGSGGRGAACPRCGKRRLRRLPSRFSARSGDGAGSAAAAAGSGCASCSSRNCSTCR